MTTDLICRAGEYWDAPGGCRIGSYVDYRITDPAWEFWAWFKVAYPGADYQCWQVGEVGWVRVVRWVVGPVSS